MNTQASKLFAQGKPGQGYQPTQEDMRNLEDGKKLHAKIKQRQIESNKEALGKLIGISSKISIGSWIFRIKSQGFGHYGLMGVRIGKIFKIVDNQADTQWKIIESLVLQFDKIKDEIIELIIIAITDKVPFQDKIWVEAPGSEIEKGLRRLLYFFRNTGSTEERYEYWLSHKKVAEYLEWNAGPEHIAQIALILFSQTDVEGLLKNVASLNVLR